MLEEPLLRGSTYLEIIFSSSFDFGIELLQQMEITNLENKIQVEQKELETQIAELKNKNTELELKNIRLSNSSGKLTEESLKSLRKMMKKIFTQQNY